MEPGTDDRITHLADGRQVKTSELEGLLYEDLHRMASAFFRREKPGITLQPTALVHEAYLKLASQDKQTFANREHFLSVAATAMRRVLMNAARARTAEKRGVNSERVTLSDQQVEGCERDIALLDLEAALKKLEKVKERFARIVELHFFAGLSLREIAPILGISHTMVVREWAKAQAWLAIHLRDLASEDSE